MSSEKIEVINEWRQIPTNIDAIISGLSNDDLGRQVEALGFSVRATVHHLVEANIVTASMIIAAMGKSGATYDWTWLYPNADWCSRLGYESTPIEPSLDALRGLIMHITNIVASQDDALERMVTVSNSPGAPTYTLTVGQMIKQEVDHAAEHLADVRKAVYGTDKSCNTPVFSIESQHR
ncbi:MAG: DinB family protein [Pyrinomonadaceae bacterium]